MRKFNGGWIGCSLPDGAEGVMPLMSGTPRVDKSSKFFGKNTANQEKSPMVLYKLQTTINRKIKMDEGQKE